jgi:predicted transposase YbfD/YdcC
MRRLIQSPVGGEKRKGVMKEEGSWQSGRGEASQTLEDPMDKSIPSLESQLATIPDPRAARGQRHPWQSLLRLVVLGLLAGANTQRGLARFGANLCRAHLRRLGFRQAPSQPTLHRLLAQVEVAKLEALVQTWLPPLEAAWRKRAAGWLDGIAVDGKTLRGARKLGATEVHLLSACSGPPGVVLAQVAVPEGTTEAAAVGALLAQLPLHERTVTFDAAFTQWAVAQQVLTQGGAYFMVVKGNQPTLLADIAAATARRGHCTGQAETVQSAHGRIERRTLWAAPATAVREHVLGWPQARQIVELHRQTVLKRSGRLYQETAYAVTSLGPAHANAADLLQLWQAHWTIESQVHWVRDAVFGEDRSTTRTGRAPQVFAAFRNLALSLLRLWRGPQITAAREYFATHLGVLFRQAGVTTAGL